MTDDSKDNLRTTAPTKTFARTTTRTFARTVARNNVPNPEQPPAPPRPEPEGYNWLPEDSDKTLREPTGNIPFSWVNPLNLTNKRYTFLRKALREINNPKK